MLSNQKTSNSTHEYSETEAMAGKNLRGGVLPSTELAALSLPTELKVGTAFGTYKMGKY